MVPKPVETIKQPPQRLLEAFADSVRPWLKLPKSWRVFFDAEARSLFLLCVAAVLVGISTGLIAASFRLGIQWVVYLRFKLIDMLVISPILGFFIFIAITTILTGLSALLVAKVSPDAEGSGIPRVEAIVNGHLQPGRSRILPVKFVGGLMAIGSGLMLGREGPLVQMGATAAYTVNKYFRLREDDLRVLMGAGAAAGLATAFNAPIAGGVFVLEELLRRFDLRTTLATLVASGSGFISSILLVDARFEFFIGWAPKVSNTSVHWVVLIGIICGFLGILYNNYVMWCLRFADTLKPPAFIRGGVVGLIIGCVGWFTPALVGGGDNLTQEALLGNGGLGLAAAILLVRFVLGPISYAAGTPGGLFAPQLVIGSTLGLMIGIIANQLQPDYSPSLAAAALIGLAAFFSSTVRTPITGMILATEMTGNASVLPAMLLACACAMYVATVAKSDPIYERLARRFERNVDLYRLRSMWQKVTETSVRTIRPFRVRLSSSGSSVSRAMKNSDLER
ncbi:ClC family H(+)/Cl(-) exchange transporter [Gleimia sp. 6138-11-ORH1]|uniref:ClC family H(+)/Cl(-) exchange transporter n=1 Tax=Gleimia sp. 6138-11-ORH1 TaxID=2973937 RepID=UPI0021687973|nr:ClC family H(+)/Cl(-) exchange transporter [Gleimia sp. 6138-11-ORH1]MCS4484424.1 ClC family H(+)/Cl(-) exchange transporter [Gleimia sp. 6138-11-ORH1]